MPDGWPVASPAGRTVHRVYGRGRDPLAPPPWSLARARYGVLGGRFDDPGAQWGIPESERFRMLYFATERATAIGESVALFRPSPGTIAAGGPRRGLVPREWREGHELYAVPLHDGLRFADVHTPAAVELLRPALAPRAAELGVGDIDVGTLLGPERQLTQRAARHVYERFDRRGRPLFHGVRFLSRHNPDWECWAVFDTRAPWPASEAGDAPNPGVASRIGADDPYMVEAAAALGLDVGPD
jgi:hypothetical protein